MSKYVEILVVLLVLNALLSSQGIIRYGHGEASPVTCVVITNPVEYAKTSNYIMTVNPERAKVIPGSVTTFDVSIFSKYNVTDVISLDIVGLPEGISATFDPAKGKTDFASKLTVSVDEMICPGVYTATIIAKDTDIQLADFKLEVAGVGFVREKMESEIAELNKKLDDLEKRIMQIQSDSFSTYLPVVLAAIIGSFLLGAFALYIMFRHMAKSSNMSKGDSTKLQEIIDLLKRFMETQKTETKNQVISKEREKGKEPKEPSIGDIWYAYCPICGLRTQHGRDYEGMFCARCGNRES